MVWVRERLGAERVSERRACQVLGQARSTQRRERHIPDDEARLVAEMVELGHPIWAIRLPADHGHAPLGRVESESQAGGKAVETGGAESPVQTVRNERDCGSMMDPAFGYEQPIRTMSGAMTSCMREPMMEGPFGC